MLQASSMGKLKGEVVGYRLQNLWTTLLGISQHTICIYTDCRAHLV